MREGKGKRRINCITNMASVKLSGGLWRLSASLISFWGGLSGSIGLMVAVVGIRRISGKRCRLSEWETSMPNDRIDITKGQYWDRAW